MKNIDEEIKKDEMILELVKMCLKVQKDDNGYFVDGQNGKKCVFVHFYGHVSSIEFEVYENGWEIGEERKDAKKSFEFNLKREFNEKEYLQCKECLEKVGVQDGEI